MRRALRIQAAAAIFGGAVAYAYFASTPAMRVLVGVRATDAFVPAHYQASAFPPFAAFVTAAALE